MQMQDYLPYFQELSLQYYQFTLENAVYAACLAIVVWLLTAIFYSLRIGYLNRRNRVTLKASIDAQNAVTAAQQEIQQLQAELAAGKEQLEQEVQRTAALQERIGGLASQLSESIVALAAQPDLGQQGLSVSPGLEAEHLWQRYSAAVKQIAEGLTAQRRANSELQQACDAEKAKLAEKDSQLQATQTRLDSQRQQLAKLEQAVEDQKTQLLQQQESADQRLAEVEAKHQADLARLAVSGQQSSIRTADKQPQPAPQEMPKVQEAPVAQPEPIKPVEVKAEAVKAAPLEPEPRPVVNAVAKPEPSIARAETAKQKPPVAKAPAEASAGVGGKFKSWFSGAKQQMEKLDDMFGLNTPMLPPEEPKETIHAHRAPQDSPVVVETAVREPEVKVAVPQAEATAKQSSAGLSEKFKNLFGSSKAAPVAEQAAAEKTLEAVVEPPEPIAQAAEEIQADAAPGKAPGKFKNLFGKFKGKD